MGGFWERRGGGRWSSCSVSGDVIVDSQKKQRNRFNVLRNSGNSLAMGFDEGLSDGSMIKMTIDHGAEKIPKGVEFVKIS